MAAEGGAEFGESALEGDDVAGECDGFGEVAGIASGGKRRDMLADDVEFAGDGGAGVISVAEDGELPRFVRDVGKGLRRDARTGRRDACATLGRRRGDLVFADHRSGRLMLVSGSGDE